MGLLTLRPKVKKEMRINLIPILDAVFIFIFFLLTSYKAVHLREIGTDRPITKEGSESKDDPWSLKLAIKKNKILIKMGTKEKVIEVIKRDAEGKFALKSLHEKLVAIKKTKLKAKVNYLCP